MKRVLIVNGKIEWTDRSEILKTDAVVCFDTEGTRHICLWDACLEHWFILNCETAKVVTGPEPYSITRAEKFTDFFEGTNKDFLKGWKFYKLVPHV
jgi:hypothetical protein